MDGGDAMAGEEGEAPGARNGRGARSGTKGVASFYLPQSRFESTPFYTSGGFPEKPFKSIILYMYPSLRHFYLIY